MVAVLSVVAVSAMACSGEDAGVPRGHSLRAVNAADAPLLPDTVDELPAFDFDHFELLGSQLNGVPVVINIWSSWCGPCRDEASALAAAAQEHGDDVQFLGVDILDHRDDAASFIRHYGWTYPSIFNASGDIRDRLGFVGQPETLFYDTSGHLVSTWIGAATADRLEQQIAAIAADHEAPPGTPTDAAVRVREWYRSWSCFLPEGGHTRLISASASR